MHFIYLKSIDAHINLDRVASVHHNVNNYNGKECTLVCFAAADSQAENEQVTLWISDPDDRAELRRCLKGWTLNGHNSAAEKV
jgi:hypothetical protein